MVERHESFADPFTLIQNLEYLLEISLTVKLSRKMNTGIDLQSSLISHHDSIGNPPAY